MSEDIQGAVTFEEKVHYWITHNQYVPKYFMDCDIKNLTESDPKQVLTAYDEANDEFGFLLLGKSGVGKTYTLCSLLKKILSSCHKYDNSMTKTVAYYPVSLLIHKLRSQRDPAEYYRCLNVTFLFLDDLGTENTTDFARENFFSILDIRCQQKKPTFITSNLTLKELQDKYGERLVSRLKEMCAILEIKGDDLRTEIMIDRIQALKARSLLPKEGTQ